MNINKFSALLALLLVLLLSAYIIQIMQSVHVNEHIALLGARQSELIEENKRIMAAREIVRSPALIQEAAEERFGYQLLPIDNILYLDVQE